MDELSPVARIVWKLARNHTWGQPMPEEAVIDIVIKDEDRDEMRSSLNEALRLPFVSSGPQGVYIPNGQGTHVEAADWLVENTELPAYAIEATLSRLPPEWPDSQSG
jgi:hypothetical protein